MNNPAFSTTNSEIQLWQTIATVTGTNETTELGHKMLEIIKDDNIYKMAFVDSIGNEQPQGMFQSISTALAYAKLKYGIHKNAWTKVRVVTPD